MTTPWLPRLAAALAMAAALPAAQATPAPGAADSPVPSLPSVPGTATAVTPLDRYLADLKTLRVTFTQQLTDGHGHDLQSGQGTLVVQRPGRFRWEIRPADDEAGQLLVADGQNLWFYDRDLDQVTVKPAGSALTATPALLLAGGGDIRQTFDVQSLPRQGSLDWVSVKPKAADADFKQARLGFADGVLRRMVLADKLGQTATLVFGASVRNGPVKPEEVEFSPPPGVDVIGTPVR
jgi:outer membrane lipoprotein carrier protein